MYLDRLIGVVVCIMQKLQSLCPQFKMPCGPYGQFCTYIILGNCFVCVWLFSYLLIHFSQFHLFFFSSFNSEIFSSVVFFFSSFFYLACIENWFFRKSVRIVCKVNDGSQHTTQGSFRDRRKRKKSSNSMRYARLCMETKSLVTHD